MHIDMEKIEKMVQLFINLNENSQDELMRKGYELLLTQNSKEELIESKEINIQENESFSKSDKQKIFQKSKGTIDFMNNISEIAKANNSHKDFATIIALMDMLSHGNMTEKYNIKIKIEYEKQDLQKYLESIFPDVNATDVIADARKIIVNPPV